MDNLFMNGWDFFTSIKPFGNFMFQAVSLIASILTCLGKKLPGTMIKFRNWRDRKAVKYSIINPQNDESMWKSVLIYINFVVEMYKLVILWGIIMGILTVTTFWLISGISARNRSAYFSIIVMACLCVFSYLVYKKRNIKKLYCVLGKIILVLLIDAYFLLFITSNCLNISMTILYILLAVLCIGNYMAIEIIISLYGPFYGHKLKIEKIIKLIRTICAILYVIFVFYNGYEVEKRNQVVVNIINMVFLYGWLILCCIENIIAIIRDNTKVEFTVKMGSVYEKTKKAIYQYENDKVKFTSNEGITKIVDNDEIDSINYILTHYVSSTKKERVVCMLEHREIIYDGYKFIKDSWVRFYKISHGIKHIEIINSKKVKKIIVKHS